MTLIVDSIKGTEAELAMIELQVDISNQLRLLNARIEFGYRTDINLEDIQTIEDQENVD